MFEPPDEKFGYPSYNLKCSLHFFERLALRGGIAPEGVKKE